MEKFDWKLMLQTNMLKLKIVGLWPAGNETYTLSMYTIWAITIISVFNIGHNFFQTINMIFIFDNLHAVVQTFYVTLSELAGLIKACFIIQNMKILKQLMVTVNSDMFQPRNARQIEMIKPSLTFWKINYFAYWSMSLGAIFCWSVYPILDQSTKEYPLPFLAWYPWNTQVSPLYELTYLYQILGLLCVATTAMAADTLIAALNVYIGAQFDILCDNIRHIFDVPTDSTSNFNQNLIGCINHHKEILKFAEDSNMFSNWIVLAQFFTSAVTIGITLFQMTVSAPFSSEFFSCVSFTFSMTVEIFMYCWFGNEVEIKSSNIVRAVYDSEWLDSSSEVKKNMIFFVMRCHKPVKMSALNLFYLSLDTFMRIMRTGWSYFALLHQVSSRP